MQTALVEEDQLDEVTGYPGTKMVDATKKHQAQKGLKVDGVINPGGPTEASLFGEKTKSSKPQTEAQRVDAYYDKQMDNIAAHEKEKEKAHKAQEKQRQQQEAQREARREFRTIDAGVMKSAKAQGFDWSGKAGPTRTAPEADNPPGYNADETIADVEQQARDTIATSERTVAAERKQQADENAARQRREWQRREEEGMAKLRAAPKTTSMADNLSLAGRSFLQQAGKPVVDLGVAINETAGTVFDWGTDWNAVNRTHAYLDSLVSEDEKSRLAAGVGGFVGDAVNVGVDVGTLGATGMGSAAGKSLTSGHQQGWDASKQKKDLGYELGMGFATGRIGNAVGLLGRGMNLLGKNKAIAGLSEKALGKLAESASKYGLDLLTGREEGRTRGQ